MPLPAGVPAPWFTAPTPTKPRFSFSSVAGRYIVLGFLPADPEARRAALRDLPRGGRVLDDQFAAAFLVVRDAEGIAEARDGIGVRWFLDAAGEVSRLYGALREDGSEDPHWLVIDPSLRTWLQAPITATRDLFQRLAALPRPDDHAGVPVHAPVLVVPRILEPELCLRLIALYEADGGAPSGVMREVDGRTVGFVDDFKRRRDAPIADPDLQQALRARIAQRLAPEIEKAFGFKATRIERYIVACYDAEDGGYFRPHRDNTTAGTAHRTFAVSINLNAEAFEGGDLRFPEFGMRTYRAPTGGAVVFGCRLLHEATPVTRGRRYATLPFLYDEAGAALRERNLHVFQDAPPSAPDASAPAAA